MLNDLLLENAYKILQKKFNESFIVIAGNDENTGYFVHGSGIDFARLLANTALKNNTLKLAVFAAACELFDYLIESEN